jgi:hypothetical protein
VHEPSEMPEQTIQCAAACTVTVQHEITLPVLDLSPQEGAVISSAILLVWAVAWAFRVLIQTIKSSDGNQPNED